MLPRRVIESTSSSVVVRIGLCSSRPGCVLAPPHLTHLLRMRCCMLMMPLPLLHFVRLTRRRSDPLAGQSAPPASSIPARPEAALAASDQTDAWRSPVPAGSVVAPAYT